MMTKERYSNKAITADTRPRRLDCPKCGKDLSMSVVPHHPWWCKRCGTYVRDDSVKRN